MLWLLGFGCYAACFVIVVEWLARDAVWLGFRIRGSYWTCFGVVSVD